MLAVAAALAYGLSDAVGEYWVKHIDRVEYLGMLGLFGALLTSIMFPLLEWEAILGLFTQTDSFLAALGVLCWYIVSLVMFYISCTFFFVSSDATLLILSLQSSNLWAILFSVAVFQESPPPAFYLAIVLVVGGVFVYELCGTIPQQMEDEPLQAKNIEIDRVGYQSID
jgi:solute carrier family 35 protein F1/2